MPEGSPPRLGCGFSANSGVMCYNIEFALFSQAWDSQVTEGDQKTQIILVFVVGQARAH